MPNRTADPSAYAMPMRTMFPPLSESRTVSGLAERAQDLFRRERLRSHARPERRERVVDRVHHRAGRAGGARLAGALGAQPGLLRRRPHVPPHAPGHLPPPLHTTITP